MFGVAECWEEGKSALTAVVPPSLARRMVVQMVVVNRWTMRG